MFATTTGGVKIMLHTDKKHEEAHALRRIQHFKVPDSSPENVYWELYDMEIQARRTRGFGMSLPHFATFFTRMEARVLRLMGDAVDRDDAKDELSTRLADFVDTFEDRYKQCLVRYTDLSTDEHSYAWMCLIYSNQVHPQSLLTNDMKAVQI